MKGLLRGREFWKMSGSGNDFVFFDGRAGGTGELRLPDVIGAICDRRRGIGADGIVLLESAAGAAYRIVYYNSDGSLAALCGNASLCGVSLARELGIVREGADFPFEAGTGVLRGRVVAGVPEIDLAPVTRVLDRAPLNQAAGEERIGFALAGVPHLVVLCADAEAVDLERRGRTLRFDPAFEEGANIDFVSRAGGAWRMRTYERGVEGETLACGTGAVAAALLLSAWGEAAPDGSARILTSSGRVLEVRLRPANGGLQASLRGEGRIVFRGRIEALTPGGSVAAAF